jgi:hypothetical protein
MKSFRSGIRQTDQNVQVHMGHKMIWTLWLSNPATELLASKVSNVWEEIWSRGKTHNTFLNWPSTNHWLTSCETLFFPLNISIPPYLMPSINRNVVLTENLWADLFSCGSFNAKKLSWFNQLTAYNELMELHSTDFVTLLYRKKWTGRVAVCLWRLLRKWDIGLHRKFWRKLCEKIFLWISECGWMDNVKTDGDESGTYVWPHWPLRTHPAFVLPDVIPESLTATWYDLGIIPRHQFYSLPIGALYGIKVGHRIATMVCHVLWGTLWQ